MSRSGTSSWSAVRHNKHKRTSTLYLSLAHGMHFSSVTSDERLVSYASEDTVLDANRLWSNSVCTKQFVCVCHSYHFLRDVLVWSNQVWCEKGLCYSAVCKKTIERQNCGGVNPAGGLHFGPADHVFTSAESSREIFSGFYCEAQVPEHRGFIWSLTA